MEETEITVIKIDILYRIKLDKNKYTDIKTSYSSEKGWTIFLSRSRGTFKRNIENKCLEGEYHPKHLTFNKEWNEIPESARKRICEDTRFFS